MTDAATPPEASQAPEAQELTPEDQADLAEARQVEQEAFQAAATGYLQNRGVVLGLEVRRRDRRIAELEAEAAELRGQVAALLARLNSLIADGGDDAPEG